MKTRLKEVIDFAENPDKTTDPKCLDDDLSAVLKYAEKNEKTDECLYVAGINCPKQRAYEAMTAVKRRFGKTGGTVAWHGFQSFAAGEVTPEEAFEIGKETARRMWGDRYQVVVTVHLNTDNLHCHFVVNPISFKDGSRFRNKIFNHRRLREISDDVCREHRKSVLEYSSFYGGPARGAYWAEKRGTETHRSMLKADIEYCLRYSDSLNMFVAQLKGLGYSIDMSRMSVRAPGWQRSVRLSSIGYSDDRIEERILQNREDDRFYLDISAHLPQKPEQFPLLRVLEEHRRSLPPRYDTASILVDAVLYLVCAVFDLLHDLLKDAFLLSPEARHLERDVERYVSDFRFLRENGLHTVPDLRRYVSGTGERIRALEHDRAKLQNRVRREKSPGIRAANRGERGKITERIAPLRRDLRRAERILADSPRLYEILKREHAAEIRERERARERSR